MSNILLPKLALGTPLNTKHLLSKGLVGKYLFNEGRGDVLGDSSLESNHGMITNLTWEGQYLTASGSGRVILNTDLSLTNGTIIFVTKDADGTICGDDTLVATINFIWMREGLYLRFRDDIGSDVQFAITDFTGVHTHAISWDGINATVYRDGVFHSNAAAAGAFDLHNIFSGYDADMFRFNGGCSNFIVYDRVLSASEIQQLYLNPNLPMQQEPIWLFSSPPLAAGSGDTTNRFNLGLRFVNPNRFGKGIRF